MALSSRKSKSRKKKKRKTRSSLLPSYHFMLCVPLFTGVSYLLGRILRVTTDISSCECLESNSALRGIITPPVVKDINHEDEMDLIDRLVSERMKAVLERAAPSLARPKFPTSTSKYANGIVKISQTEFKTKYNDGTPKDFLSNIGNSEAIILYNTLESLPTNFKEMREIQTFTTQQALQNCDTMNVVYQNPKVNSGQCLAILSDYESYHLQKWMQFDDKTSKSRFHHELHPVGQTMNSKGRNDILSPDEFNMKTHEQMLNRFLNTQDQMKLELKEKLERIAIDNIVIVMTTNFGQSELLTNFVCAANAKGFDISNVLVFATDPRAANVSEGLGLETFYDEENFGSISSKEAMHYGDKAFTGMMYSKVLSALLVNSLGFDILFQDLDIVWYKHPLALFNGETKPYIDKDIILQDDGSRSQRFSPSFANSGFYFARYNDRTQYLFVSLLYSMGMVLESGSHQKILIALMNEHSSKYGLRVEILRGPEFPAGKEFHRNKSLMKDIIQKRKTPYLFHMSWTKNKVNKIKFFKQMGVWHVKDSCEGEHVLRSLDKERFGLKELCCSMEPLISCSYKDKPSVIPCKESPSIDENGRSFW